MQISFSRDGLWPSLASATCLKVERRRYANSGTRQTSYLVGFKAVRVARAIVVIPRDFTLGIDASVSGGNCPWDIRHRKLAFLEQKSVDRVIGCGKLPDDIT